ncbi:hypothetical protein [Candidatus Nitrosocosmicus sp. R]
MDDNQESFGRCPDGFHKSPSGDCERVTENKGKPRCPDGFHRSPDGDCEAVNGSSRSSSNDDDDEGKDRDSDNDEKSTSDFDIKLSDLGNSNEEGDNENDIKSDKNDECPAGFSKDLDGGCKSILGYDTENENAITSTERNSIPNTPDLKNEGIVFKDANKKNTFYDQSGKILYMIIDSEEIAAINDKDLVKKLTVKDIKDPVYDISENNIYFLSTNDKINVFDGNEIQPIDTGVEIDDLEYNPSNGYTYATSSEYGKIFVLDNEQIIKSLDIGLGQVDYLAYNPSNGYMYGVDSYKGNIIILDPSGIKGNLSTGYRVDYLAYNPSNGYMYGVGNEYKEIEKDPDPYPLSNNSQLSGGLQPFAEIQQFNQDVGNGPICCDITASKSPGSTGSLGFGESTNGKITIINGTQKIHSLVLNSPIENIELNPVNHLLYVLSNNPGKASLINDTEIIDTMEIGGNPKKIFFNPANGLTYVTKENNYDYSIDVFEGKLLKNNIPIKYLYDEIVVNPSNGLVYMLDNDIVYLIENGSISNKIILNAGEEQEVEENLF